MLTFYRCEKCKREFNNIADTKKCENNHLKISEAHIKSHGIHKHPYEIEIVFNNGDKIIYVAEYMRF
ncbi:MAG: hypothetical protein LBI55_02540 [Oscillospiraceae bacterium]|jgi:hypothetical protein|nr:hypothetical protein [Oscillospiraceae bacterium]